MTWEELYEKYGDGVYKQFFAIFLKDKNEHINVSCWESGEVVIDYTNANCMSHITIKNRTYDQMDLIIQGLK